MIGTRGTVGAALFTAALLTGCPDREVSQVIPAQDKAEVKDIPLQLNRNLDLLFVVDNSGSMKEEQAGLVANFPKFTQVLQQVQGGLPDIHMGVVSVNVGAGNNNIQGCAPPGNDGQLLQGPPGTTCAGLNAGAKFISDIADPTSGVRMKNYSGNIEDVFSCMATLGTTGCGLEAPLESMRRALEPSNAFNTGFIRSNAFLGIVIISDEDDCSTRDTTMFNPTANLGPINFRCTRFGIECDGDPELLDMGPRTNCRPKANSQYMYGVDEYINFVRGLKSDPNSIVVAGILGNPEPVAIGPNTHENKPSEPALQQSCESVNGFAVPAVRTFSFLQGFPNRNSFTTICATDLSDALVNIANLIKEVIGDPCIQGTLKDINLTQPGVQPDCVVSQVTDPGTDHEMEKILPECLPAGAATHTNTPCWYFEEDLAQCSMTPSKLKLKTDYNGGSAPLNTHIKAQCVVN
jgi:hypothetical protein